MSAALGHHVTRLRIEVSPSGSSNDHQARILLDGNDWLGKDLLGLDPPDLTAEFERGSGLLLVGRCGCGVIGCVIDS